MPTKNTARIESTCQHCGAQFLAYRRGNGRAPRYCSRSCYHATQKGTQPPGGFQAIPAEERFWEKVDRSGGPDSCWPWLGGRDKDGYGKFSPTRRKSVRAHRFAYELTYGPIPPDLDGLHRCDNPPCCNPIHILPGTQHDNRADCVAKGRQAKGEQTWMHKHPERSPTARLTWNQVREIRAIFDQPNPPTHQAAADAFGIPRPTLRAIIYRRTWRE